MCDAKYTEECVQHFSFFSVLAMALSLKFALCSVNFAKRRCWCWRWCPLTPTFCHTQLAPRGRSHIILNVAHTAHNLYSTPTRKCRRWLLTSAINRHWYTQPGTAPCGRRAPWQPIVETWQILFACVSWIGRSKALKYTKLARSAWKWREDGCAE